MSRSFQEMVSTSNILGPYTIKATVPSLQSQGYEDPVIWCSGGQYHLVANDYNARKANHYTSTDGINNWKSMGLAYDPTSDFVRYTDGTVNHLRGHRCRQDLGRGKRYPRDKDHRCSV